MKGKADLVQGWLRKAESDLVAMRASAQAGALDAACFHAQQAAEKYLKAYLTDRDLEIIYTHNLFKLLAACAGTDSAFDQLIDAASLLTPFAVQARYDAEFWPTRQMLAEAELAANRVAELVCSRVQSMKVMSPAFMQEWKAARAKFNWRVDLRKFKDAAKHQPSFFNRVIEPEQVTEFEDAFRAELVPEGRVERAAEVVYWKNKGLFPDKKARDLLENINTPEAWERFVNAVKNLTQTPTWESFLNLKKLCGGFAVPITFLSFSDPHKFPMVDQRIGKWWKKRFSKEPQFVWAGKIIAPSPKSWEAYLTWTEFCRRQAAVLSWRARDVEMAVWSDKDAQLPLDE